MKTAPGADTPGRSSKMKSITWNNRNSSNKSDHVPTWLMRNDFNGATLETRYNRNNQCTTLITRIKCNNRDG